MYPIKAGIGGTKECVDTMSEVLVCPDAYTILPEVIMVSGCYHEPCTVMGSPAGRQQTTMTGYTCSDKREHWQEVHWQWVM